MNKDKCCGNCKHFDGVVDNVAWCPLIKDYRSSDDECVWHHPMRNGWTEITPDNMEEVYGIDQDRLVIQYIGSDCHIIRMGRDFFASISTMAKYGGYYYHVLPELMIE